MSIDSKIVTMKFDNAQFKSEATTTLSILEKLKASLNFGNVTSAATKGLGGIASVLSKFGLKNPFAPAQQGLTDLHGASTKLGTTGLAAVEGGVTGISKSFIAMSTIAITALSNIVTHAMSAGGQIVKSLTFDPVKSGLSEYETNLNSIQTILANTKVSGTTLDDVNVALQELNHYSDKTIYNFGEMAKNIGTFTAAGVDLETSVSSIKGIANLAALSGSNSQQASTAMYQLSQEIAAGRVSLMGWNSVVNAGMGGSTFQRALVTTAQNMGTLKGRTVEFVGEMKNATIDGMSFRDSIMAKPGETSWLSKEVLTGTLEQFTNDMTRAELAAQGFTQTQIKDIQQMAKTAEDAATKVKTLSGVFDTAKEVVGSGWAKTWQTVFGDFKEARTFFTNFSNGVNDILGGIADKRNEVLAAWKERGGRDLAIEALKTAWESLLTIMKPIQKAFRDIFPATTARDLMELTRSFAEFAENLAISGETAGLLRRTFAGVFAVFSIVGQVIGAIVDQVGRLFGAIGEGSGGFLSFTGGIGDMLVALDQFLEKSGVLQSFFGGIGNILAVPLNLLKGLAGLIGGIFTGFNTGTADKVTGAVDQFGKRLEPLAAAGERVGQVFEKIGEVLANAAGVIGETLSNIGDMIANAFTPESFEASLDVINTGLLAGIVLMIRKFFTGGLNVDLTGGLFDGVKETLGAATGALQNMQASLKADILMKIAIALGVLTASLVVLALIDGKSLTKALTGMAVGFGALSGALILLSTAISFMGVAKLPIITAALIGLAGAMLLLSVAIKILSTISWEDLTKGLLGVSQLLGIIAIAMVPLTMSVGGMIRVSAALIAIGIALNIMAVALKIFATMSWEEMAKGLVGVAGSLLLIAAAMWAMPPSILLQAAALVVLGIALNAIGAAVKIFASMGWEEIAKGMVALAGALAIIAGALWLMPPHMLLMSASLILVGIALNAIGAAVKSLGGMSWKEIAKGLVALGGALLILAGGLYLMSGTLLGAAALMVAAAALTVLTPVLITLGSLDWMTIIKGLTAIAGLFLVLGLAGLILAPLVPVILGLSIAVTLLGAGLALAGVGALAFATAFALIVATGTAGVEVMATMLGDLVKSIPAAMGAFGRGIIEFTKAIAEGGPLFVKSMSDIIGNMLDAVIKNVPKMARAFNVMLNAALRIVVNATPRITEAGLNFIESFLEAVERHIGDITEHAADIIVEFLRQIAKDLPRIINAGVQLIIRFINGVATAIDNNSAELGEAGGRLAWAIVAGIVNGIFHGVGYIQQAAINAAQSALEAAKRRLGINSPSKVFHDEVGKRISEGMALGIKDGTSMVTGETKKLGKTALETMKTTMGGVSEALALNGDFDPVISPILDLSQLTREANRMSSILAASPIDASVSYSRASDISAETEAAREAAFEVASQPSITEINLEQNNYSPKPLPAVDIYRGTRNQLSLAKEALTKS